MCRRIQILTLEDEVLNEIRADGAQQRKLERAVTELRGAVERAIADLGIDARPILVGSVAKGTHLRSPDIDMFIMFPEGVPREEMEAGGLEVGGAVLQKPTRQYAEHPYTRGRFMGFEAEIVPCYAVPEAHTQMSAVDRTPFHTRFVTKRLDKGLRDQVRLFKAFAKGIGVYGAEIAIQGFSGYLCEILVIKYGGFRQVLEAATKWRRGKTVMEIEGHPGTKKFDDPMVFIDPVDSNRNVAAPVSDHSYSVFVHAAGAYLWEPDRRFFFPNPVEILSPEVIVRMFRDRGTCLVGVETGIPDVVEDVYYSQLRKGMAAIERACNEGGFPVLESEFFAGRRALFLLELEVHELSPVTVHTGPEIGHPNVKDFLTKWKGHERTVSGPSIRGKRWIVHIRREYTKARELLDSNLLDLNLGKDMNQEVRKGFEILGIDEVAGRHPKWSSEYLDDRFPWER